MLWLSLVVNRIRFAMIAAVWRTPPWRRICCHFSPTGQNDPNRIRYRQVQCPSVDMVSSSNDRTVLHLPQSRLTILHAGLFFYYKKECKCINRTDWFETGPRIQSPASHPPSTTASMRNSKLLTRGVCCP